MILMPVLNKSFRRGWEHQWRNLSTGFQNYTTSQQAPPQTTPANISVVQSESIQQLHFDVWCNALMPGEGRKYIVWLRQVFPLSGHAGAFVILTKILFWGDSQPCLVAELDCLRVRRLFLRCQSSRGEMYLLSYLRFLLGSQFRIQAYGRNPGWTTHGATYGIDLSHGTFSSFSDIPACYF